MNKTKESNQIRQEILKMTIEAELNNKPIDYNILSSKYERLEELGNKGGTVLKIKDTGLKFNLGV